jgi:1-acyl-sn-glycerol-3-phosphate acyltransferase
VGGVSVALDPTDEYLVSACLIGIAVLGYLASRSIPKTRAVDPELTISANAWRETWRIVSFAREDRAVFLSILGISWFWFYGSAITLQIPAYTLDVLNGNETVTTVMLVAFAVGIGIGSLLCEKLSRRRIELGLVPFGAIGLTLFAVDLHAAQPVLNLVPVRSISEFVLREGSWRILGDVALLGAFGGLYSVPLYALIQHRAERRHLSRIIAANNILNALFMVIAAIMALLLLYAGLSIPKLFLVLAGLNAIVAILLFGILPEFLMRFLAWVITNTLYRIRATGLENVPDDGPALIVCNHVSYVDALVVGGALYRPVRFVMWYRIFDIPLLRFLFRTARAIPIASASEDPELLSAAFDRIDAELAAGNLVCIFPEGEITHDGHMTAFRRGVEKILARRPVPVVPVALGGLWGSWFSRRHGGRLRRLPGKLFARVDVRIGEAVPARDASAAGLEILVRTLRGRSR